MKRIIITFLFPLIMVTAAMAQSSCPYCHGTGTVVKNISVSQYGLADYKVKCPTCGAVTLKSTGHSHIHCQHCGGTGRKQSSRTRDNVTYDPDSPEGMQARALAYTIKSGLPYTDKENEAVKRLKQNDPAMANNWERYRQILNQGTIHFNQNNALCFYRYDTVQNIDAAKNSYDQELAKIGHLLKLPNDLYAVYQQLYAKYQSAYNEYRDITGKSQHLRNLQEQLDNYILMKNMFY